MSRRRLLWQLYPIYLTITLFSVFAVSAFAIRTLHRADVSRRAEDMEARAKLIGEMISAEFAAGRGDQIDAFTKRIGTLAGARLTLIDADGIVLADSEGDPGAMDFHAGRPEVIDALSSGRGVAIRHSRTVDKDLMYVAVPLEWGPGASGALRLAVPLDAVASALGSSIAGVIIGALAAAGLATAVWFVAVLRVTAPIEAMKRGADRFARGEFETKLSVPKSQELGSLAEAMNRMADQLDERIRTVVRQRNEHEAVLASMVEGVVAVDREERLLSMNAAAERVLGLREAEAQGRSIQEVVRNTDLQRLVARTLKGESPIEGELVIRGEQVLYLQAHGSPLRDAQGRSIGAVLVLNDITRMRRLETLRSDFVANVSHELKTPITSIKGFVETLVENRAENPAEFQRFLQIIARHADRLSSIIDDLLSLSRIEQEAERGEIPLESADLTPIVESAIQLCEPKAGLKHVRLVRECAPGLRGRVNAALLEQAIINLIDNAIKYSPEGAIVEIRTRREGAEAWIEVIDRGPGIASEHLPRLFERFYRVDKARSRKMGGTGLGLSIVKHIVQAHGGRVGVESRLGQGSRFLIVLKATG